MTQKVKEQIQSAIENLAIKKNFKINENGNKVKVRRDAENQYAIYLNGHFISTLIDWKDTFEMAKVLLLS